MSTAGKLEGLEAALLVLPVAALGIWLCVSANLSVQNASLVHHIPNWTQRQLRERQLRKW